MPSWNTIALGGLYATGAFRLTEPWLGGLGAIVRIGRVAKPRSDRFQPLWSREVTPDSLDAAISLLRRSFDIVPIGEVCGRLAEPAESRARRRFVCLTCDGGDSDFLSVAYPVFARHQVPFTVYVASAFPDGLGEAWWLALEQVIARNDRVSLIAGDVERRLATQTVQDKFVAFGDLYGWLRSLDPPRLSAAINDLCRRHGVDLRRVSADASMSWDDLRSLARDQLATIGSATVNMAVLSNVDEMAALREMTMGRAVVEAALGRDVPHFAFPFGDRDAVASHRGLVARAGFASAVTAVPAVVKKGADPAALPRIALNNGIPVRALRVKLSGMNSGR